MFSILIVDDEPAAREGLMNYVNWASLECEIAGEASDGIEACEILKCYHIDIAITDIKMPGMDGIELAAHIHENYPETKTIILTGYADFNYAQSAIDYGVVDFVLKPIIIEKITYTVKKAIKLLEQQNEVNRLKKLEDKVKDSLEEMKEKFIYDILNGILVDNNIIEDKIKTLGVCLANYFILAFEINSGLKRNAGSSQESHHKLVHALKNLISLSFKDLMHYNVFINDQMLYTIICFDTGNESDYTQTILTICEKMLKIIDDFTEYKISIGISNMHKNHYDIKTACTEAQEALSNRFYSKNETSICIQYSKNNNTAGTESAYINIYKIISQIESGNCESAVLIMNEFLEKQRILKQPIEYIKNISIQLCILCSRLLTNHKTNLENVLDRGYDALYKDILESRSINYISDILTGVVKAVSSCLSSSEKQTNYTIGKAIDYIKNNFKSNINLQVASDFVHVSSGYLSRLFKKETGYTLIEFITKCRMEKAKELLKTANIPIFEVASIVGIDDPAYFSQVFKKYTGLSPKEFKYGK